MWNLCDSEVQYPVWPNPDFTSAEVPGLRYYVNACLGGAVADTATGGAGTATGTGTSIGTGTNRNGDIHCRTRDSGACCGRFASDIGRFIYGHMSCDHGAFEVLSRHVVGVHMFG